jgi:hypothetical protein
VVQKNANIADDISALTFPLLDKFPKAMMKDIMSHSSLQYDDVRIGNKGACLNFYMLGVFIDKSCTYRHSKANPTEERVKVVVSKLGPAIQEFMADGGRAPKKRKTGAS